MEWHDVLGWGFTVFVIAAFLFVLVTATISFRDRRKQEAERSERTKQLTDQLANALTGQSKYNLDDLIDKYKTVDKSKVN